MTFPAIEELIPHRDNMLLIREVIDFSADTATCISVPSASAWYASTRGEMPAWIGIELMAQTIAAHVSLLSRMEGKVPQPGVLLGTRAYTANIGSFAENIPLWVDVRQTYRDISGLASYDCLIRSEAGQSLATAALTVCEPEDFEKFLRGEGV